MSEIKHRALALAWLFVGMAWFWVATYWFPPFQGVNWFYAIIEALGFMVAVAVRSLPNIAILLSGWCVVGFLVALPFGAVLYHVGEADKGGKHG